MTRFMAVVSLAENKCRVRDADFLRDGFGGLAAREFSDELGEQGPLLAPGIGKASIQ